MHRAPTRHACELAAGFDERVQDGKGVGFVGLADEAHGEAGGWGFGAGVSTGSRCAGYAGTVVRYIGAVIGVSVGPKLAMPRTLTAARR